jgi:hypothetical protein
MIVRGQRSGNYEKTGNVKFYFSISDTFDVEIRLVCYKTPQQFAEREVIKTYI